MVKESEQNFMIETLKNLKDSSRILRDYPTEKKNQAIFKLAELLKTYESQIIEENQKDLDLLTPSTPFAFRDRLQLNARRIQAMIESCLSVARLHDPVSEITDTKLLSNKLVLKKVRTPIGVIFLIFESRPNVAIESFILSFKSGNSLILKGGKESKFTCEILFKIIKEALNLTKNPTDFIYNISAPDRDIVKKILKENKYIDVVIPRGGDQLIEFITQNTTIPIIKNDRGLCHTYIHEKADLEMAKKILHNAKTGRPGVCNATETVLIDQSIYKSILKDLFLLLNKVEFYCDDLSYEELSPIGQTRVFKATGENYHTEYLDLKINCKIVQNLEEAMAHIEVHGSKHSECIITNQDFVAKIFQTKVDASCVYWNASTRFTDGFEFGLGGEIGISTQKLHVRGPVGLKELTCEKWLIDGTGQIRT